MSSHLHRIKSEQFISAGYVITRLAAPLPSHPASLGIPVHILSLSSDLAPFVPGPRFIPDSWALRWVTNGDVEDKQREACLEFGIDPRALSELKTWVTERFDAHEFGWTHIFFSITAARDFAQRFLPKYPDAVLLGIGVATTLVSEFLTMHVPDPGSGSWGYYEALRSGKPLAPGGVLLGFEVVGLGLGGLYSWLDNHWHEIARENLGIQTGKFGLLGTFEEAARVADYPYVPETEDELAPLWQPWALVRYPLSPE